ncbi:hypothetical protein JQ557_05890 [Bradyrhizobium sp. U87765 SZCCT0131]|nr:MULTISPECIES: hypothetical protein [unclassified Bradyrhizobium]MBR1217508.1 hypothetical protein [Bradyrhizobium sp. U87765 SZCCT0131]MBR1264894.1 hypothetical protein [Bradyrhizobium sp. U87765 SZCCT0134]MBR1304876.1 hypothetical protein [Bradyrhizobium sp. U87765 SZCCT0110]MBR1320663.1 hypothetical protein [Bradyrhizobium sp. U87765 SZCCT0109]MBR1349083.1 hypothetical protein [Bradyrhizobium sp. U87765 SZCCT0048]
MSMKARCFGRPAGLENVTHVAPTAVPLALLCIGVVVFCIRLDARR